MKTITAHCLVKNEDVFIEYAIRSVIDVVDAVLVFDTGSNDSTVSIVQRLRQEYPAKIIFEQKGPCDKERHTQLRQEMVDKTTTDWFMILDGDEVWTTQGARELKHIIEDTSTECVVAPFHLCVGDVFHEHRRKGHFIINGKKGNYALRALKKTRGIHWGGVYENDTLYDERKKIFCGENNTVFLDHSFWHCTHLRRSSGDAYDYSSGSSRLEKERLTFFGIGKKIRDPLPEVFNNTIASLDVWRSFNNFLLLLWRYGKKIRSQFTRYFITGTSGVVLDIATLYALKEYAHFSPVLSVVCNQIIMLTYIFLMNKFWSFKAHGDAGRQMIKFYLLAGANYLFSIGWMWLFAEIIGINYLIARLANIVFATLWNFLLYRMWVFADN
ncbi:MAG: GtrA family protein [Candidatus Pacebacteria bacterium]|nr:GtrA family protein [Candidatus Paceibacterota bacterium]